MNHLSPLSFALHLFLFFFFITSSTPHVSINCGSAETSAAANGRQWLGDSLPKLSNSFLQLNGVSTTSTAVHVLSSADPVPHKTARLSRSRFSYAVQVNPGQIIIRFHFNPSSYKGFKGLKDLFTVEAGSFTLLGNFSASLRAAALAVNTFAKEFYMSIEETQTLIITFSAVSSRTYAFINGIEIISLPMHLSYFKAGDIEVQVVGKKSLIYVDSRTALELIDRINVKRDSVLETDGFDDVLGIWGNVPNPKENESYNLTWKTPVDVGFRYLVRIHFSNMGLKKALSEGVIFKVQINEKNVDSNVDILEEREDRGILEYRDYMVEMKGRKQEGKRDLLISFQSYDEFMDGYKLIKGFEIFKLSNHDDSLASPNALLHLVRESQPLIIRSLVPSVGHRNAIATVLVTLVSVINIIVYMLRKIWEATSIEEENKPSARAERLCRHFSLSEIQLATRDFNDGLLIGRGGFGKVYKGLIDRGKTTVAIKRLKSNSRQGALEFLTEIETLSELRHVNLVSLIGYCNERGEMILVYDYMAGGTLADHLYKLQRENNDVSSLTWMQRLNICIGAGRGLDYLHTGHGVIHRDVKASNILLDENFVAKVSDFGLAKPEDRSTLKTHVSTNVKGTRGYLDPHYVNTCNLTRKSDVYAFGVVLLEVLCGRPPLDWGVPEEERILTMWARDKISKGKADQIVASTLTEEIAPNSLETFVGIAKRCLHDEPKNRPTMSQTVLQLEYALEQQDNKQLLLLNERTDIELAVNIGNPRMAFIDVNDPQHPSREEQYDSKTVNPELPSGRKYRTKSKTHKQSRFWPWEALWNRANPSKEIEMLLSAPGSVQLFTLKQIKAATNKFDPTNKIGEDLFSSVYKGLFSDGTTISVKQFTSNFKWEFVNEIGFLSALKHPNLVKLYGYCVEEDHLLLIYEFMENSLSQVLFGKDHTTQKLKLNWPRRRKLCLGLARGLAYLHGESWRKVIHRDIKPSTLLLDKSLNVKISDFTLAKLDKDDGSHISTRVIGTFGYMAPEYVLYGHLTNKADVYSFGVVVLEIVSGKRNTSSHEQNENICTLDLARDLQERGSLLELIDPGLGSAYLSEEALMLLNLALLCTQIDSTSRPTMSQVVSMLEGRGDCT